MAFDDWKDFRSILCVRLDNMGDVLMTTPAFRALKQAVPDRRLTLLTSSAGTAIARLIPEIDEVIVFDVPWVKTNAPAAGEEVGQLIELLKERNFDAAVLFTVYSQNPLPTAMICYLAGIKRVLGYCRENPYELISDWVPDPEPLELVRHEVDRQLQLVASVEATVEDTSLSLSVTDDAADKVAALLHDYGVDTGQRWLVLHPGVSEEKRRYPAEAFILACRELIADYHYQIILTGSQGEREYCEAIRLELPGGVHNLAGELQLPELCALIATAPVLVSNNTGPVHIAAAVQTPVVVLYAMTNPQHTPWQVPNRVLYFEVPEHLRSKNRLLQSFPGAAEPAASPEAIVRAVLGLSGGSDGSA